MHSISVRHSFETAHRLPHLEGKCQSLHGHSWWAEVTVECRELAAGLVVEFGPFKKLLREWIDAKLDHGTMLGAQDPLVPLLEAQGCKVWVMPTGWEWPTVENVAVVIAQNAEPLLHSVVRAPGARVVRVDIQETHVNKASWVADV